MKSFKLATVTLLVAAAALSTSAFAKDGTYTAQEVGRNGAVKVQVIVKGNKIESVKVLDWSETHPVADLTQTQLIPEIVKYQTTNVNNISGATLSSFAIKAAVNKCLKEAGLDVKQFQKPAPKPAHYCGLPFIKYHHASGGGKLNDVFMRTAGISVANQIEVDSNSTMLSLIAQGAGWTISRASTILQNKGLMNEILYLPMPEPLLVRKVYVLTHQNEPSALMQEFTQLACSILKESVAPELIKIAPWLEQDIFVLDPTSGVMVDMTGKRAEER